MIFDWLSGIRARLTFHSRYFSMRARKRNSSRTAQHCSAGTIEVLEPKTLLTAVLANIETTPYVYTASAPPQPITSTLTLSDASSNTISSATIQIDANYVAKQDRLSFTNTPTISGAWNPSQGTLTLSGTDTVGNYQAALQSVFYQDLSTNPDLTIRRFAISVDDGSGASPIVNRYFTFGSMISNVETTPYRYKVGDPATTITSTLQLAPTAGGTIASAHIQIDANYFQNQDVLAYPIQVGKITGTFDPTTGTLALTGTDTVANYQAALRSVTYQDTSSNPATPIRRFRIWTNDANNDALISNRYFNIILKDQPPSITAPGSQTILQRSPTPITGLRFQDPDAGSGTETVTLSVSHGILSVNSFVNGGLTSTQISGNGTNSVTLNGTLRQLNATMSDAAGLVYLTTKYSGADSLAININDNGNTGFGGPFRVSASLKLTVLPVNSAPQGTSGSVSTLEDTPLTIQAANFGFTDPANNPPNSLTAVKITTLPGSGTLSNKGVKVNAGQFISVSDINGGNLIYTPGTHTFGINYGSFNFQVQDNGSPANGGTNLDPVPKTLGIDVAFVDHAPKGTSGAVSTTEDTPLTIQESNFGFSDPNNIPQNNFLSARIDSLPAVGTLTDNGLTVSVGQFVSRVDIASGKLIYTPGAHTFGTNYSNFTFQVKDDGSTANGTNLDPSPQTLTINVTYVDHAPTGKSSTITTNEDLPVVIQAANFGFSDPNNVPANYFAAVKISALPTKGKLTLGGTPVTLNQFISIADINYGKLVYQPGLHTFGSNYDNFGFQVADDGTLGNNGTNLDPSSKTLTFNVSGVNHSPVGTAKTISTVEDVPLTIQTSNFGFTDPNNIPAHQLQAVKISTLPAQGILTDRGKNVVAGQFVTASDISSGLLVFTPGLHAFGAKYGNFTFQVQNDGTTANGGSNLDPQPKTLAIDVIGDPTINQISSQLSTEGSSPSLQVVAIDPANYPLTYSASGLPAGLSIDSTTGSIGGTISLGDAITHNYSVVITATNSQGATGSTNFTWIIVAQDPLITQTANQSGIDGSNVSLQIVASDPANYSLTYTATGLPNGLSINANTGLISGTITTGDAALSPYNVQVTTTNSYGGAGTETFQWTVSARNPLINSIPNQSGVEQSQVSLQIVATDPGKYPLTYSAVGLPLGLSVNAKTGVIGGSILLGDAASGPYTVTVTAKNLYGGVASTKFTWNVTAENPVIAPIPKQSGIEKSSVSIQVHGTNPANYALTYSAIGLPAGLHIGANSGLINGTISLGDAASSPYTVIVTAQNAYGGSSSVNFTFTVTARNPSITPAKQSGIEGSQVSYQVPATDPANYSLTFGATGLPAGLKIDKATGVVSGSISLGDAKLSPYTVTVTASNPYGGSATSSFAWLVTAQNPVITTVADQTGVENSKIAVKTVATDPAKYPLTYSATGLPAGLSINPQSGLISGTIAFGNAAKSPYKVSLTVSNAYGGSTSTSFNWAISSANPIVKGIGNQSSIDGTTIKPIPVVATDPGKYTVKYTGTGFPAGISIDPNSGIISGTITPGDAANSPYSVQIGVSDPYGGHSTISFTWTVKARNPSITLLPAQSNVDQSLISLPVVATDAANYKLTYSAKGLPSGLSIDPDSGVISGKIALGSAASGPYVVTINVVNPYGGSSNMNFLWNVTAQNPIILSNNGTTVITNLSNVEGASVSEPMVVSSPGNYPLTFAASGLPNGVSINPTSGLIGGTIAVGDAVQGPYTVSVTVSNAFGGSSTVSFVWSVVALNPIINTIPNQRSIEGSAVTIFALANDPTGYAITYSSNNLPNGLTIDSKTGKISGTLAIGDAVTNNYLVKVTANNPYGGSATTTFSWTVLAQNPVITPIQNQSGVLGSRATLQIAASDPAGYQLSYFANGLPNGLTINSKTGTISGAINPNDAFGAYTVQIAVGDAFGGYTTTTFVWSVNLPNQVNVDNDTVSYTVQAISVNGNVARYAATNLPPGLSIDPTTGQITGTVGSTDDANSPYQVTITASYDDGTSFTTTFTWTINP